MNIVELEERHLPDVLAIYNHYVAHTTVSFDLEPLDLDDMRSKTLSGDNRFRSYAIVEGDSLIGYALLARHKAKPAYDVTAEITIYLAPAHLGLGIGPAAVAHLEAMAKELGFHSLVAVICTENERSARLFERLGYERCALFREVGRKFDRWLDVASYQKII
ncbi:MAG: N-acetyltransferase [Paenibacillaceae bacterium]|nr:N-acetyltransferase [Paenibacillaceae bacterium]